MLFYKLNILFLLMIVISEETINLIFSFEKLEIISTDKFISPKLIFKIN